MAAQKCCTNRLKIEINHKTNAGLECQRRSQRKYVYRMAAEFAGNPWTRNFEDEIYQMAAGNSNIKDDWSRVNTIPNDGLEFWRQNGMKRTKYKSLNKNRGKVWKDSTHAQTTAAWATKESDFSRSLANQTGAFCFFKISNFRFSFRVSK